MKVLEFVRKNVLYVLMNVVMVFLVCYSVNGCINFYLEGREMFYGLWVLGMNVLVLMVLNVYFIEERYVKFN